MKQSILHVLIIYTLSLFSCHSQELKLKINSDFNQDLRVIDSLGYLKSHDSFRTLSNEIDSLTHNLYRLGYFDLKQFPTKRTNDTLFETRVNLGKLFKFVNINLTEGQFSLKELSMIDPNTNRKSIQVKPYQLQEVLNYLNTLQSSKGSPFSSLQLVDVTKSADSIFGNLQTRVSTKRTIDKILVKGYDKFPRSFIKHGARIKQGQTFNKDQLEKKSKRLDNLPFSKTSKSPEILFTKDSTNVYLYLKKVKANTFDGFLGFSNNSNTDKTEINGYLDLALINNLNFGEQLNLAYKADGREQVQLKINISLPYLLKTPIGILAGLEIFKRDSSFVTIDQSIKLNYQLNNLSNINLGYKGSTSNSLLNENTTGLSIEDYDSNFITIGGQSTKPSNQEIISNIYNLSLNTEIGRRKTTATNNNQVRAKASLSYNYFLNRRNIFYIKDIASVIFSENTFNNELYRFGGIQSIRGFEENNINATLYNVIQTEYRYLMSKNLYAHTVVDYAYYENQITNVKDQLYSLGAGIALSTQSGLLKLIFANGKLQGQSFKFSNTKVHLSLNARF